MIGKTISHYKIVDKLGEGGMGAVYKAEDTTLNRFVAIKALSGQLAEHEEARERFVREAQAASALNHPNITTVYDLLGEDDQHFICMEYVDGKTIREMAESGPVPVETSIDIILQATEALEAAHEEGILHRDIKSANIMVTTKGRVKVMDFGLAHLEERSQLTRTGTTMGTLAYSSPEQISGRQVDQRSEIFSLGVVSYELLTGQLPFRGASEAETVLAIISGKPKPISEHTDDVSDSLVAIVTRMLQKEPGLRYQSCTELITDLQALRAGFEITLPFSTWLPILRKRWARRTALVAIPVLMIASAWVGLNIARSAKGSKIEARKRIAILPASMGGDPDKEYFNDGIAEGILSNLSKISDIKPIAFQSILQYKGTTKSIREIGSELQVGSLVRCRAIKVEGQVRVSAQLIDVTTEEILWARDYVHDQTGSITIQSEVALAIAMELSAALTPDEQARIEERSTDNFQAEDLYLMARYNWNQFTPQGLRKSLEFYQQAIQVDSSFAPAYAGLAAASNRFVVSYGQPPQEYYPRAKAAALHALQLDPNLAEAHAALGLIKTRYDWDWEGAEQAFQAALDLKPNDVTTHVYYQILLTCLGRHDEAIEYMRRAVELDPMFFNTYHRLGIALSYARRYEEASEQFRKALELNPTNIHVHLNYGTNLIYLGMSDEAIAEIMEAVELSRRQPGALALLGYAYGLAGKRREAQQLLDEIIQRSEQGEYISAFYAAAIYLGLGRNDEAFEWVERARIQRHPSLTTIAVMPACDPLRSDPRFIELLKQIGLDKVDSGR